MKRKRELIVILGVILLFIFIVTISGYTKNNLVIGKYVTGDPDEYLYIKKDGTFYLKEKSEYFNIVGAPETTGKWKVEKDELIFSHPLGIVTRWKIKTNVLIDDEGKTWFIEGSVPKGIKEVSKESVVGTYIDKDVDAELILNPEGGYIFKRKGFSTLDGVWELKSNQIKLYPFILVGSKKQKVEDPGLVMSGEIIGQILRTTGGLRLVKQSTESKIKIETATNEVRLLEQLDTFARNSILSIDKILSLLEDENGLISSAKYFEQKVESTAKKQLLSLAFSTFQAFAKAVGTGDPFFVIPSESVLKLVSEDSSVKTLRDRLRTSAQKYKDEITKEVTQTKKQLPAVTQKQIQIFLADLEKREKVHRCLEEMVVWDKEFFNRVKQGREVIKPWERLKELGGNIGMLFTSALFPPSWPMLLGIKGVATFKAVEDMGRNTAIWLNAISSLSNAQIGMLEICNNTVKGIKGIRENQMPVTAQGKFQWNSDYSRDHGKQLRDSGIVTLGGSLGLEVFSLVNINNTGVEKTNYKLVAKYTIGNENLPASVHQECLVDPGKSSILRINFTEPEQKEILLRGGSPQKKIVNQYTGNPPDAGKVIIFYVFSRTKTGIYGIGEELRLFSPSSGGTPKPQVTKEEARPAEAPAPAPAAPSPSPSTKGPAKPAEASTPTAPLQASQPAKYPETPEKVVEALNEALSIGNCSEAKKYFATNSLGAMEKSFRADGFQTFEQGCRETMSKSLSGHRIKITVVEIKGARALVSFEEYLKDGKLLNYEKAHLIKEKALWKIEVEIQPTTSQLPPEAPRPAEAIEVSGFYVKKDPPSAALEIQRGGDVYFRKGNGFSDYVRGRWEQKLDKLILYHPNGQNLICRMEPDKIIFQDGTVYTKLVEKAPPEAPTPSTVPPKSPPAAERPAEAPAPLAPQPTPAPPAPAATPAPPAPTPTPAHPPSPPQPPRTFEDIINILKGLRK